MKANFNIYDENGLTIYTRKVNIEDNFMKYNKKWSTTRVEVWAHSRWSLPELIERKEFKNRKSAANYCKKINSKNTDFHVPDYYTHADILD